MRSRPGESQETAAVESVVIGAADSKQFDLPRLRSQDGQVVADATKGKKAKADAPVPHFYRVQETRNISQDGYRTQLQAGKILSNAAYDIQALKRQGVKLEDLGQHTHEAAPI
jgi:hypothetical protein